ncbi:MAG TPA: flagellar biosynthetic protein FliR [Casimicrobiaceae bacterium]|nr:flagellar biosynthetic protein FliR [Casimicrobiaceae bacterium]
MISFTAADIEVWLAAFLYPFLRILALMSSAPLFSHESVPVMVRIGLAFGITFVVSAALPAAPFVSPFSVAGMVLVFQQVLVGLAIGLAMQLVFAAVTLAGDLIGLQMGLSFAAFVDPLNAEQTPLVGGFLSLILMLVFLAINGHLALIAAMVDSFTVMPVGPTGWKALDAMRLVSAGGGLFATGVAISLPVVGALLLVNLTLGVLTRTAPQLNLFAVGFPVTLAVGLVMLLLAMPFALPALQQALERGLALLLR